MELIFGFVASRIFDDPINFPYGFSKSGFFSIAEADILSDVGDRLQALELGFVKPENEVEQQFLAVCNGEQMASTRIELVWQKYKKHSRRKSFQTLGSNPSLDADRDGGFIDDSV